jgi:hypothetical protein
VKTVTVAVIAAIGCLVGAASGRADSPTPLGGVELVSYCQSLAYVGATLQKGYVVGHQAAYANWRCTDDAGTTHPFSMEQACQWMYGLSAVLAQPLDRNDAFSWVCYAAQRA